MDASVITKEDLTYLAQQSEGKMNLIISGMASVLNDTESKISAMESQTWFQRMVKTVTGKNRITKEEIQRNSDRLNAYMIEALTELYNRNCIDHEIIMSLGTQLNQLYAEHLQLKQMLGAFVSKLNEKIESVDNFHMLTTEIEQGVFSSQAPIVSICKIFSQCDNRILDEPRKLDIIRRSMNIQGIVSGNEKNISEYLSDIVDVPVDDIGVIYMELGTMRGNFIADMLVRMIENYHLLPDLTRKLKRKDAVIQETIEREGIDVTVAISTELICEEFLNTKLSVRNGSILLLDNDVLISEEVIDNETDLKMEEVYDLFLNYRINATVQLCEELAEQGNGRAMYLLARIYGNGYEQIIEDSNKAAFWREKGYQAKDILATRLYAANLEKDSLEQLRLYKEVFPQILESAESGDVLAQYELMWSYEFGCGTKKDISKAVEWGEKTSNAGLWAAMYRVAYYYEEGIGCPKDYVKAFNMYMKAAECGYGDAMDSVGYCYGSGVGVSRNDNKAFEWYMKAANAGSAWGMYHVGWCYEQSARWDPYQTFLWYKKAAENGHIRAMYETARNYQFGYDHEDSHKDYKTAFKWYEMAAERGNVDAQFELAESYCYGRGVDENQQKAREWYEIADSNGHRHARYWMERNGLGN